MSRLCNDPDLADFTQIWIQIKVFNKKIASLKFLSINAKIQFKKNVSICK